MNIIDPNTAMCNIFEYIVANGIAAITIKATLEQRLKYRGNIIITPLAESIDDCVLLNVALPTYVINKIGDIVKYDFVFTRVNIL